MARLPRHPGEPRRSPVTGRVEIRAARRTQRHARRPAPRLSRPRFRTLVGRRTQHPARRTFRIHPRRLRLHLRIDGLHRGPRRRCHRSPRGAHGRVGQLPSMLDLVLPIDAMRLCCSIAVLDLLRNVGRIRELVDLFCDRKIRQANPHPVLGKAPAGHLPQPRHRYRCSDRLATRARPRLAQVHADRMASRSIRPTLRPRRRELSERLSIAQAEARARVHDPLDAVADVPFGFLHARCLEFLAQRQPDDVLWRFESRRRVGQGEVWREGYAWVGRRGILAAWASASETDGSG